MSTSWHPENYVDEYQAKIHQWIEESVNNKPHKKTAKTNKKPMHAISFVELLKKSLAGSPKPNGKKKLGHAHRTYKLSKYRKTAH